MNGNRIAWWAGLALVALCAIALGVRALLPSGPVAPDFTLTDGDGRPYTLSQHRGATVALFFGYTHCTDVCPMTLAALERAKRKLGGRSPLDVVFITVDPKRDDPAALKRYVRQFDPAFVGLTGTQQQLDAVYAAYHVFVRIGPPTDRSGGYDVSHSSAVQFISPDGRLRGIGDWSDSPDRLAALIRQARS